MLTLHHSGLWRAEYNGRIYYSEFRAIAELWLLQQETADAEAEAIRLQLEVTRAMSDKAVSRIN
jgi:hypothetical protein